MWMLTTQFLSSSEVTWVSNIHSDNHNSYVTHICHFCWEQQLNNVLAFLLGYYRYKISGLFHYDKVTHANFGELRGTF